MDPHPNAATDSIDVAGVEAGGTPAPHRMTTDRLRLHRVHPDAIGFDRLYALFADLDDPDEVFDPTGWDAHGDEAETRAYLDRQVEAWGRGAHHEYVVEAGGDYVGTTRLELSGDDGSGELALWLRKPYWGRGFSGEATDALVHAAFRCLDAPFVVAGCLPSNDRSRRAIEKSVRRYDGAYCGSPPTVPSRRRDGDGDAVVPRHEWVVTREGYASGERGLSTLVPGVEYDELDFRGSG